jgi:hypothetical protein
MTTILAQILWQSSRLLPLAIGITVVALLGVLALYLPQARRLRQPWRWGLPILRGAVCVAVAASVLQPTLVRSESSHQPGAVVVLVDDSRSMSVVDPRSPAERVALADALGLLPAGTRPPVPSGLDQDLRDLAKRVEEASAARADAEYAKLSGQGVIAAQTRYEELAGGIASRAAELARRSAPLPAGELSAKLAALVAPSPDGTVIDYRPRIAAVEDALEAARAAAAAALYDARSDVKRVADELSTLTRAQVADRALHRAQDGGPDSLPASAVYAFRFSDDFRPLDSSVPTSRPSAEPRGLRSDIAGAVRAAIDHMKGRVVQAVIVLSDGRQVGGSDLGVSSTVGGEGVPIYGVITGSREPRDLAISDLALAPRQFVGETTKARVRVRGTGMKGMPFSVKLDVEGRAQSRTVTIGDDGAAVAEFPVRFDTAAVHGVTVSVAAQPGEMTTANNTARRWVVATTDRAPISLVGASASWDFQQARVALTRAPWAIVDAEVLDAPGARWSVTPDFVAERSAVVLFDVTADHLAPRQWDALYELVTSRGGTLVFVAGRNTVSPQFIDSPLLTDLLPFRAGARPVWRTWSGEQPLFRFQPGPAASDAGGFRLGEDGLTSSSWFELPAVFQYVPVADLKPNTTPLLVERESGLAVLTDSRLGLGHVLFFGVNETWRWRRATNGVAAQERLWQQLARYAVDAPYAVRSGRLRLDADRVALSPGESVRVRARVARDGGDDEAATGDSTQSLTVLRDGAVAMTVPMAFVIDSSGKYSATLDNLSAGTYELRLRDPHDPSAVASLSLHVEPDAEAEMRDVTPDDRTLRRLAESTGGEVLRLEDWETLPQRLRTAHGEVRQVAEKSLWDSPQLFAFILGCLGVEWTMRKRLGLA